MKLLFFFTLLFSFTVTYSQNENLKLHYIFNTTGTDTIVKDVSGHGYDAHLKNNAYVDQMGGFNVLNLGFSKGYLDMGEKAGELISTLHDFSILTYVLVDGSADLSTFGNFVWAFSNSDDILKDQNGCLFFSAINQRYAITKTDYRAESGIEVGSPLTKKTWNHVVYTQSGNTGTIYLNGTAVKTGSISIQPSSLGHTTKNYIGRSPYSADAYLKGMVADFRIYDKALTSAEVESLDTELTAMNTAYTGYQNKPVKYVVHGNPLFTHEFTADPAALVYNDTFYIYAGEDTGDGSRYNMPNWVVFSSKDLKTWEEYPVPLKCSDFSWATGNTSWAGQVIERNGKFYWYMCAEHATIHGKAVGVAISDSPTGPFKDARGSALITNDMTTKWTGISWDDIDPTVWIDDDGQAYLFWGNTQCYCAKLKNNMIELASPIMPVNLPNYTEAPWIHKRGDWYYLSYASGFPERTCYAMSRNINGPWEYKGILNELSGNCNTNHQAIVPFKGDWYFVYHNGGIQPNGGSFHRSVCIDYLYYNPDSTIKRVQMTTEGVDKVDVRTTSAFLQGKSSKVEPLNIYPNPTDTILNIELPDANKKYDVSIYDLYGTKLVDEMFNHSSTGQIIIAQFPNGTYLVRCTGKNGFIASSKLIIN